MDGKSNMLGMFETDTARSRLLFGTRAVGGGARQGAAVHSTTSARGISRIDFDFNRSTGTTQIKYKNGQEDETAFSALPFIQAFVKLSPSTVHRLFPRMFTVQRKLSLT